MVTTTTTSQVTPINRTFRGLSREEIADPDRLDALEAMGLGSQFGWDELLDIERVLIVASAGAGKTYECQERTKALFAEGRPAFFLTLEGISANELKFLFDREQFKRFEEWLADGHSQAHFFLDSADELLLSHGDFRLALRRLAHAIDGQLHRARIIVTSRPIALDLDAFASELPVVPAAPAPEVRDSPGEDFRRLISGEARKAHHEAKKQPASHDPTTGVRIAGLTALSQAQIERLAASRRVTDLPELIAEIDRKRAWEFARRPQELIEICSYWNEHRQLGTRAQQIAEDIRRKLQESGSRKRHVKLSDAKALEGAKRLALAQVLTRKRTIRFSDLSLDNAEAEAAIDPSVVLGDWPEPERSELLQRPLFASASYGRVRFQHRSAPEFLSARRLQQLVHDGHMPRSALHRLLFGECYGQQFVFPSMRAVAAWLALSDEGVREEVLHREPEALMDDGDPESFAISTRSRILTEYVRRYGQDDWRGVRIPYPQVLRFASPDLSATVRDLWEIGSTGPEVRELLIDLVQAGRMRDCLDIAESVALDGAATETDRVTAIAALAEMTDPGGLAPLVASLLTDAHWPSRIKEGVIEPLFPKHVAVTDLVALLGQIEAKRHTVGGIGWTLPRLIPAMELDRAQIVQLREALATLMASSVAASEQWPHFTSPFRHLTSTLATVCLAELDSGGAPSTGLVEAAVLAVRLRETEYGDEKPVEQLQQKFFQSPRAWRKPVFIAEGCFVAAHMPSKSDDEFGANLTHGTLVGPLDHGDFDWLVEIAADSAVERRTRAAAFWDALFMMRPEGKLDRRWLATIRELAADEPVWRTKLDEVLKLPKRNRENQAREAIWKKQSEARAAKQAADIETWVVWRDEVLRDPDAYFTRTATKRVVWDFAQVLERAPEDRGWRVHWNRAILIEHFNVAIAERVEEAFRAYWRTITVPLRSELPEEERNTVWTHWSYALAGVYAEAGHAGWARDLSPADAVCAARLARIEMDGVPPWIKDLILHQAEAVDVTLGCELTAQLAEATRIVHPALLADFARADSEVLEFFAPRVWAWLSGTDAAFESDEQQARMHDHLERAVDYVLRSSRDRAELAALAERRLDGGLGQPFAIVWLTALLAIDPGKAVPLLERQIGSLDPEIRYRLSEGLFAGFGDRRSMRFGPDLGDARFTPDLLLGLVRLAYAEIRYADDIDRSGTGPYSSTPRDEAQHGRSAVLGALLNRTGPDAWAIKQTMRSDPLFAHFKDRLDQMAREKAASEAEGPALTDPEVVEVEKLGEAPPADRNGMFAVMIDRLADLSHDIAAHEFSERPILAGIDQEKEMQVWFAKRLQDRENGVYRVDREAMVINAKETDIRLLSVKAQAQAVIELKLANNDYSVSDLIKALETQLVGQYMRHDNCRAGCLLVTMNRKRTWKCPDEGSKLEFTDVISQLQHHAAELEARLNHEIRLAVVGIDLAS